MNCYGHSRLIESKSSDELLRQRPNPVDFDVACLRDLPEHLAVENVVQARERWHVYPMGMASGSAFRIVFGVALLIFVATQAAASAQLSSAPEEVTSSTPRGDTGLREPGHYVLLLYSEARLTPSVVDTDQALRSNIKSLSSAPFHSYSAIRYLRSYRGASFQGYLFYLLRLKYRDLPIDLIIGQGQLTVPFAFQFRAELFPSVPIVLVAVESSTFDDPSATAVVT